MPIFFMHIRLGDEWILDGEGIEFPTLAAAHAEAVKGARSIMSEEVMLGHLRLNGCIEVHDGSGLLLTSLSFRQALTIED